MASYYIWVSPQACAQNKFFLAFKNTGADQIVELKELRLINGQTAAATGVAVEFDFIRITAITGGTDVTPVQADSGDGTLANFTCVHTATSVTAGSTLFAYFTNNDEVGATGAFPTTAIEGTQNLLPAPIISRNGSGVTVKQITNSTAGSFGVLALINVIYD